MVLAKHRHCRPVTPLHNQTPQMYKYPRRDVSTSGELSTTHVSGRASRKTWDPEIDVMNPLSSPKNVTNVIPNHTCPSAHPEMSLPDQARFLRHVSLSTNLDETRERYWFRDEARFCERRGHGSTSRHSVVHFCEF